MKKPILENRPTGIERPIPSDSDGVFGSDAIADMLRALDIPYIALNPGSSYRGLHDSLVNRLGNERPQMLLCMHEDTAVGVAHGWAKVTNRAMMAMMHANVGLMHGTMAIHNAWCDRVPMLLLGAIGPMDAPMRRPGVDWVHTVKDLGALIRHNIKWDDQPESVAAAYEAILRARKITETAPHGPTFVVFDVTLQEERIDEIPPLPDVRRFMPPAPVAPAQDIVDDLAKRLLAAKRPLLMYGLTGRSEKAWAERVALAESTGAMVLTQLRNPAAFPTDHPQLAYPPARNGLPAVKEAVRAADLIVVFDWYDIGGTIRSAFGKDPITPTIVNVALEEHIINGWSMDYQALPPTDIQVMAETDPTVAALAKATAGKTAAKGKWDGFKKTVPQSKQVGEPKGNITVPMVAGELKKSVGDREVCLVRVPISWAGHLWPLKHPLDMLGGDGGGGIGSGPSMTTGGALALRHIGSKRMPIGILGDGDFMMGNQAIWTAVHYKLAMLIVIVNNRSYYNDELHQQHMAKERGRLEENKGIGLHMTEPAVDFATIARGQGATGFGPVTEFGQLAGIFVDAIKAVEAGETVVIDVRVDPGYDADASRSLLAVPRT